MTEFVFRDEVPIPVRDAYVLHAERSRDAFNLADEFARAGEDGTADIAWANGTWYASFANAIESEWVVQ